MSNSDRFYEIVEEYFNRVLFDEIIKTDFRIVYDMDLDEIFKRVN